MRTAFAIMSLCLLITTHIMRKHGDARWEKSLCWTVALLVCVVISNEIIEFCSEEKKK